MRSSLTLLLLAGGAGALITLPAGCKTPCGDGTVERDGECVPSDFAFDDTSCGPGTVLGDDGMCVSEYDPTICGPNTIADEQLEPGVITCVGTGGGGCTEDLRCENSSSTATVNICGRIYDVETDDPFIGEGAGGTSCTSASAVQEGPCELSVKFYDAIAFANGDLTERPNGGIELDDCGRFRVTELQKPGTPNFIGIAIDDGPDGSFELTGVAVRTEGIRAVNGEHAYIMRSSTNTLWSTTAFGAGNPTFVERGTFMPIFLHGDDPIAGVTVIDEAVGVARPNDDYYFTDVDPTTRQMVTATGPTGANGTALLLNSGPSLSNHTGSGAEPTGCEWGSAPAKSIPGALFVSRRVAEIENMPLSVCP